MPNICFFCDKVSDSSDLHSASTLELDEKVRNCANLLSNGKLLAKLAAGDMIALEPKYHSNCLVGLYNRARQSRSESDMSTVDSYKALEAMAFADLIAYIDDCKDCQQRKILKLADPAKIYSVNLDELTGVEGNKVNSTRLKERLIFIFF